MPLEEYRRKRRFEVTPEPDGTLDPGAPAGVLRFVVHRHAATRLHYDLRLEMGGALASWAVPRGPSLDPADRRLAVHVEDHPMGYFDFEGVIPKGEYGGGTVMVWDWGTVTYRQPDVPAMMQKGDLKFDLVGRKLQGAFALVGGRNGKDWLLIKKNDFAATPGEDVTRHDRSVLSGRTTAEIAAEADRTWHSNLPADGQELASLPPFLELAGSRPAPLPARPLPMLATRIDRIPAGDGWSCEPKLDGFRLLASVRLGQVRLWSRSGADATRLFPELSALGGLARVPALLDGEVVALDQGGAPSFSLLQQRTGWHGGRSGREPHPEIPVVFYCFDVLHAAGLDLTSMPLRERRRVLSAILLPGPAVRLVEHFPGADAPLLLEGMRAAGQEGIVLKREPSPYFPGARSRDWLKLKVNRDQDCAVVGYTQPQGGRQGLGSLALAVWDQDHLSYCGQAGSGLDQRELAELSAALEAARRDGPPEGLTNAPGAGITWVEPRLVCRVRYTEWTRDGHLRHPTFIDLRADKLPADCTRDDVPIAAPSAPRRKVGSAESGPLALWSAVLDCCAALPEDPAWAATEEEMLALDRLGHSGVWTVGGRELKLTNLDKVLFPGQGYTKRDLVRHHVSIAPLVLPHLVRRPLSMHPHPDGIEGKSFWMKDRPSHAPGWLGSWDSRGTLSERAKNWVVPDGVAAMAWLGNNAVVDLHPWFSRTDDPEHPDRCAFDLDPGPDQDFEVVLEVARVVRTAIEHYGLRGYPKTTGKRGLHIFLALTPGHTYEQTRDWVGGVGEAVRSVMPEVISSAWAVGQRGGLLRIDHTQNVINKTLATVYSPRPADGAPVSVPLTWDEVASGGIDPREFTIATVHTRLRRVGDLFAELGAHPQHLPAVEPLSGRGPRKEGER
ncbi:MAG: DNA ligase D [Candidatus Dormibacteria bacterium]